MHESLTREIDSAPKGAKTGAFFDLDRTIIAGFSAFAFLADWIMSGRMTVGGFAKTVLASLRYETGGIGFSAMVNETSALLEGFDEDEYSALGETIFEGWLAGDVYPEARAIVRAHQKRGHTVAVVSAATKYQIDPIAHDLGIDHVLCTELEIADGRFTGSVVHPTCFREGKAVAARRLSSEYGLDLERSFFYTDSRDDLALLNIVGNPRPVNPDRRLAEIAAKRGWPSRNFESRGLPSAGDLLRTALTIASILPSFAAAVPTAYLDGEWRRAVNLTLAMWGELGTALAGIELRVAGESNLWRHRPAVFIFNHQSAVEAMLICKLLRRDFVGISKEEVRSYPILGSLVKAVGTVFVDRSNSKRAVAALGPAIEALREGLSVVIAPEGTRSATPRPGKFKKGAFRIAMEADVPIVPIVFRNTLDALPKHGVVFRPATVEVEVLPPIETTKWKREDLDTHIAAIRRSYLEALELD
jgi:putative phosphoserine phosphatase/1-acylglycerol-3-phosphate O-acyltransferase